MSTSVPFKYYSPPNPEDWGTYTRFNVDFNQVASGWEEFDPARAASQLGKAFASDVAAVGEEHAAGRIFLVGDMGEAKDLERTLAHFQNTLPLSGKLVAGEKLQSVAGIYCRVQQESGGVPIFGAELTFHADPQGSIYACAGIPVPDSVKELMPDKKIGANRAQEIVAEVLSPCNNLSLFSSYEVYLPVGRELVPC